MELTILAGTALKNFTRSLTCLTKFGEDIDVSCTPTQLKLSSVNASRSAFGVVGFKPEFFARYDVRPPKDGRGVITFCVTGKALLSPLKPRSANSIESITISLLDGTSDDEGEGGECRLVVRLHCQHGVVKTHRLTYGASSSLYAKANRANCTSFWIASSRVLKDWIDHFHLRGGGTGSSAGGTDEISFYHLPEGCKLKSFGADINAGDALSSRPLGTELAVDVEDFDKYEISGGNSPVITFALKEFKAIIALSDALNSTLSAAFTTGGSPILIETDADDLVADFVIATTDFDSDPTPTPQVKRESGQERPAARERTVEASGVLGRAGASGRQVVSGGVGSGRSGRSETGGTASRSATASNGAAAHDKGKGKAPLFNPPSPQQGRQGTEEEEEDEFGDAEMDFDEGALAEIDRMSQLPPTGPGGGSQRAATLVPDTAEEERAASDMRAMSLGLGPTQREGGVAGTEERMGEMREVKKAKWNLLGD